MCNVLKLEKGYQYCESCSLITPHTEKVRDESCCDVCGHYEIEYWKCPNCGWNHDPDRDMNPETTTQKIHEENCKYKIKNQEDLELLDDLFLSDDCDCPEVTCYIPNTMISNYRERSVFSMDCMNAIEWEYDVRCPICNETFEVDDSNC